MIEDDIKTVSKSFMTGTNLKSLLDSLSSNLVTLHGNTTVTITTGFTYNLSYTDNYVSVTISEFNPTLVINMPSTNSTLLHGRNIVIDLNFTGTSAGSYKIKSGGVDLVSVVSPGTFTNTGQITLGYRGAGLWYVISNNVA